MAADDHGAETVAILVVRIGAQQRQGLAVLIRSGNDHLQQPRAVDLAAVQPRHTAGLGQRKFRGIFEQHQDDRREFRLGRLRRRELDDGVRRCGADDDDRIESGRGKAAVQLGLPTQGMLDHARVGPLDLDMLSDQQSIFVAGCNHQ